MYRERTATVLEHTPIGAFVQLTDSIPERQFGAVNNWRKSSIREYLNGEFAHELTEGNLDELIDTVTDLTAMDGTTDYGHSADKVTLLTVDQCQKYRYIHPLPDDVEWTSTPDGTPGGWDKEARFAWYLYTNGNLNYDICAYTYGARPAFTLPSSLVVGLPAGSGLCGYTDAALLEELLKRRRDNE
jgi:hypothetical protein